MRAQEPGTLDNLIETQWDIPPDLKKMLNNPVSKMRRPVINALVYHASVLNKMLMTIPEDRI